MSPPTDTTAWPPRRWLCQACRTTMTRRGECGCGNERAVTFGDAEARDALVAEVWGVAADPSLLPEPAPPTPRGIVAVGLLAALLITASQLFANMQLAFAAALVLLTLPLLSRPRNPKGTAGRRTLARPPGFEPIGAAHEPPALRGASGITGTVRAEANQPSPLRQLPCVAFSIDLTNLDANRSPRILHDGATLGFAVHTDDGDTVVIPRGRVEIVNGHEPADEFAARLYLARLDPMAESADGPDPFPFESATEAVVRDGDRVSLHNAVRVSPDPAAIPMSYRQSAATLLIPVGPPRIELATNAATKPDAPTPRAG